MAGCSGCAAPKAQFRLIAAPSRASAARSSSSSTADRVSATFATDFGSGARLRAGPLRRDSGACRSASRPTALQPKKRLTRCRMTSDECWISSASRALHPQHQRGRFLRLSFHRPRPLHLQRLGVGGDFGAGDVSPARHQFARGKTLLGVGVGKDVAEQDGKRFCRDRAGFCHGALYHLARRRRHLRRHGRVYPGHPRLGLRRRRKTWMPGTSPGMTWRDLRSDIRVNS